MRKLISLITVFSVLTFNVLPIDAAYSFTHRKNNVNLAPPLIFSPLGSDNYHKKFIALATIGLQKDLSLLDKVSGIEGKDSLESIAGSWDNYKKQLRLKARTQEKERASEYTEETVFAPARVETYFDSITHINGCIFSVPVSVEKPDKARENYILLFSTIRDNYGGFPSVICERDQYERLKDEIKRRKVLPEMDKKDKEDIERYIAHEGYPGQNKAIDRFLARKMGSGEYFVSEEDGKIGYYGKARGYYGAALKEFFFSSLNEVLSGLGIDGLDRALEDLSGKPLVFVEAADADLPELTVKKPEGKTETVKVRAHTGSKAVYIMLGPDNMALLKELDTALRAIGVTAESVRRTDKYKYLTDGLVLPAMAHETGVLCALPGETARGDAGYIIVNDIDRMFSYMKAGRDWHVDLFVPGTAAEEEPAADLMEKFNAAGSYEASVPWEKEIKEFVDRLDTDIYKVETKLFDIDWQLNSAIAVKEMTKEERAEYLAALTAKERGMLRDHGNGSYDVFLSDFSRTEDEKEKGLKSHLKEDLRENLIRESGELNEKLLALIKANFAKVVEYKKHGVKDPLTARKLELLYFKFITGMVDSDPEVVKRDSEVVKAYMSFSYFEALAGKVSYAEFSEIINGYNLGKKLETNEIDKILSAADMEEIKTLIARLAREKGKDGLSTSDLLKELDYEQFRAVMERYDVLGALDDTKVDEILMLEDSRHIRRAVWELMGERGKKCVGRRIQHVKAQNSAVSRLADEYGLTRADGTRYTNFYQVTFDSREFDYGDYERLMSALDKGTKDEAEKATSEACKEMNVETFEPWDALHLNKQVFLEADGYFPADIAMEKMRETFSGFGLDTSSIYFDRYPVEGKLAKFKFPHPGVCFPVDKGDIRSLSTANNGSSSMATLFHETGHAVDFFYGPKDKGWLPVDKSLIITEGMARFMENVAHKNPKWIMKNLGMPKELTAKFLNASRIRKLLMSRGARDYVAVDYFDRTMYELTEKYYNAPEKYMEEYGGYFDADTRELKPDEQLARNTPEKILTKMYWERCKEKKGFPSDPAQFEGLPRWAGLFHFLKTAAYLPISYQYAHFLDAHNKAFLKSKFGTNFIMDDPAIGEWLKKNYYRYGQLIPWKEMARAALGEDLDPRYYIREMTKSEEETAREVEIAAMELETERLVEKNKNIQPADLDRNTGTRDYAAAAGEIHEESASGAGVAEGVKEILRKLMEEELNIYNDDWHALSRGSFTRDINGIVTSDRKIGSELDNYALIFSKGVTFDGGLGVLLPKLAASGIPVGVVAETDEQKAMINELNRIKGLPAGKRIICASSAADIVAMMSGAVRPKFYYFRTDKDNDDVDFLDTLGVTTCDVTALVEKIIKILGKAHGISDDALMTRIRDAARTFARAA
ncbi:MAG: hypothetical protein ABH883_02125 [Candidatus Omnitrophota bacterium]